MRREQQAQPQSSHTTRRHPRKEGTQRQQPPTMQEEKTSTTISPSSFPQPQGNGKTRGHHATHTEQANPHPSITRQQNFLPSRHQWDTEPNSAQSHAVHHTRRKIVSRCALPLPPPHGHGRRQQASHATSSMHHKRCIQIHCNVHLVCVVVCACSNTKQRRRKEGAEYVERRTKMYSGDA
ncbi:hypothetical protein TcCL_Unassigned04140 [Trypanosoma cruzi]|nr:hypothetical protein TcCL_Unassigned04140 [Trypanosoma cruzi]